MIRVRMLGGLGNQLFQFFAAKKIQAQTQEKLCFDFRWNNFVDAHPGSDIRNFDFFSEETILENREFTKLSYFGHRLRNYASRGSFTLAKQFKIDAPGRREPCVNFGVNSGWALEGYYQTLTYYLDFLKTNPDFKLTLVSGESDALRSALSLTVHQKLIGVHVRGGDYKKLSRIYAQLNQDYYVPALDYLKSKFPDSQIMVFTDDLLLAKEIIKSEDMILAPELSPSETLVLMNSTHGLITANSTFSTWAAVTGRKPKLVVSPRKWFSNSSQSSIHIPTATYI